MFVVVILMTLSLGAGASSQAPRVTPYPWSLLSDDLRIALLTDSLPPRFFAAVYINVTEPLLTAESVLVPNGLEPPIWNALTDSEKTVLEDYWKRYENVPGDSVLSAEEHAAVVDKALALISAYNENKTWPRLRSLSDVLETIPDVTILEVRPSRSAQSFSVALTPSSLRKPSA